MQKTWESIREKCRHQCVWPGSRRRKAPCLRQRYKITKTPETKTRHRQWGFSAQVPSMSLSQTMFQLWLVHPNICQNGQKVDWRSSSPASLPSHVRPSSYPGKRVEVSKLPHDKTLCCLPYKPSFPSESPLPTILCVWGSAWISDHQTKQFECGLNVDTSYFYVMLPRPKLPGRF